MRTLAKTFAAAALIAVSTFTMAAGKPVGDSSKKVVVNLSTADLAIDYYLAFSVKTFFTKTLKLNSR